MRIALITGATRGIGAVAAKQLAEQGLFVYIGSRSIEKGKEVANELTRAGLTNVRAIELDVTNPATITAAKNTIEKEHGKLDILINNAGISGDFTRTVSQTTPETFRDVFETNFFGLINVTQTFLELLRKSASPRISNITSGLASLALHSDPSWMYYPFKFGGYGLSKTAVNAFTIALAFELKDSPFKVNAIDPGYTATEFNGFSGPLSPEDSAAFVIKHTLTGEDGPTGKFFSNDIPDESKVSPW